MSVKKIFTTYFTLLNESSISYAITGRTEEYPERMHSDIDIIIPTDMYPAFWQFMHGLERMDINWVQVISHETDAHYCVISLAEGTQLNIIKPDVCSDYYRKAVLFLKAEFLLENRTYNPKGFYQLAPEKEFIYYLLKKVDKANINQEQFRHLHEQYMHSPAKCLELCTQYFGSNNVELLRAIFQQNDMALLMKNLFMLRKDLHRQLAFSAKDYVAKLQNRIKRMMQPTGLVVAFMGPDGSGKSTVIEAVKDDMIEIFRQYKQFHLYPKEGSGAAPTIDPHAKEPRSIIGSVLKLFYFWGLYSFGYWTKVYPLMIKSTFIIFDRYYHDILIDSKRYRNGAPKFITRFVGFLIPKPDVWILLDAPAAVIQSRKQEVSFHESERQVKSYHELFEKLDNAYIVNANQSIEKVIFDAEKVISHFLNDRTKKRYKKFL